MGKSCLFAAVLSVVVTTSVLAQPKVLMGDVRLRPPEMLIDEKTGARSGPLLEVFSEAAKRVGYAVEWRAVPFPRSLEQLKTGDTDIVPRLVMTDDRKAFVEFLGPIGVQPTEIEFLVKSGKEHALKSYDDLKKLSVGVKRKTAYFEQFDTDKSICRMEALDDDNLAQMFNSERFDTMIVLDKPAVEKILKNKGISGYAWADYKVPLKLGIYFGMAKTSKHAAVAKPLSEALAGMVKSGRVAEIYKKFNVLPPPTE